MRLLIGLVNVAEADILGKVLRHNLAAPLLESYYSQSFVHGYFLVYSTFIR